MQYVLKGTLARGDDSAGESTHNRTALSSNCRPINRRHTNRRKIESDAGISDARLSDAGNTHIYLTGGPVPRGAQGLSNLPKDQPGLGENTYKTSESFLCTGGVLLPITHLGRVSLMTTRGATSSHQTLPNIGTGRTIHFNNKLHVYPSPDTLINPSTDH